MYPRLMLLSTLNTQFGTPYPRSTGFDTDTRRTANAAEMSSRVTAACENVSQAGKDSYRRMHAIVLSQMDQISGWARLQDDMKASFEEATGIIRQLNESNAKLRAERNLLRAKIDESAEQQEETTALLKRTDVIVEKFTDENAMLRIERNMLLEESMDAAKQHIKDMKLMKEIIAAHCENWSPRPEVHQESRDQRARSLSSFFFCPCVFQALPHVDFLIMFLNM